MSLPTLVALLLVTFAQAAPLPSGTPRNFPPPPTPAASVLLPGGEVDRSTPRRTVDGFVRATRAKDYALASQYLDARALPRSTRTKDATALAEQLALVIELKMPLDTEKLSDDPAGGEADGSDTETIGTITIEEDHVPITLNRTRLIDGGRDVWVFSKNTVAWIPSLYAAHGAGWLGHRVPAWAANTRVLELAAWQWIILFALIALSLGVGAIGGRIVGAISRRVTGTEIWGDNLARTSFGPTRTLVSLALFDTLLGYVSLPASSHVIVERLLKISEIVVVAWLILRLIYMVTERYQDHLSAEDTAAELSSRDVRTRLVVLRRVGAILVVMIASAAVLMQFEVVRSIGVSLLASAGIFSVVLGIAAQRTLGTVIAGVQLSVARPVRLGDVVVIEGEFGTVEEVNLTYVVMKLWDERRLIVPISKFLETSFQNWSRTTEEVLGVVLIHVDLGAPLDRLRAELTSFVEAQAQWDHRTCKLQVTDCNETSMTVRVLVSAKNADDLWTLRCEVREHLLTFVRELDGGVHLPVRRNKELTAVREIPGSA
jgi:small-conductance mechanosensitive channel